LTPSASGVISFIGLGSNLGKPLDRCREGIEYLKTIRGSQVLRRSSYYRTEPVGFLDQEWFINAVIEIRTSLTAQELIQELQSIEKQMGRQKPVKWGPRIIDLDILLYGQEVIQTDSLKVPHPELHKRRFVLEPLYEIAPYAIHPAFGVSVAGLRERLSDKNQVERINEEKMVI
jgi:2-amino-4-hydroxy-6-hydroxymethyldihydropteridine diphosphokinase